MSGTHRVRKRSLVMIAAVTMEATFAPGLTAADPDWIARGRSGMVATESYHASQAGLEMLEHGGNAIDAAVAASFALAVTRPWHTGPGGGGFLIARFADGKVVVQDFRETAPAGARPELFLAAQVPGFPRSELGFAAVAVPGVVAGRCQAMTQWGTLPLARALQPAIRLAKSGWPVDQPYVEATREVVQTYDKHPRLKQTCAYVWKTHLRQGRLRETGEILKQPELAHLLRGIADQGADFFYRGVVAEDFARTMSLTGGEITREDLAFYSPKMREPLIAAYREYKLILMPPPSSGGVALAQALNILAVLEHHSLVKRDPALAAHYQIEALKHAFADRAALLGDPDFVDVPVARLTSEAFGRSLAALIRPDSVGKIDRYGSVAVPDDSGTSHICVADKFGNVVVSTETINTTFGSLAAIDEWGLVLNNEMDDFTTDPGRPNAFGLIQSQANVIAPGKRPLSSMMPTIVLKDDRPYLLLGAAGGPRIISAVLHVLLGVVDGGLSLEEAVARPRIHHQWMPNEVYFDALPPPADLAESLSKRGHKISDRKKRAVLQAILRTDDGWLGASDPRGGGKPAGY